MRQRLRSTVGPRPTAGSPWPVTLAAGLALSAFCTAGAVAHAQGSAVGVEATTIATASPWGVAYDTSGNLYVALQNDHMVVFVDGKGLITTLAGTGEQGFAGDGGVATSAILDSPTGVAVDGAGNIYIADTHNHRVREVSNGTITTIAGTGVAGFSGDGGAATAAELDHPTALSVDASGNLYIADSDNHRIRMVSAGMITTVAGDGEQTFSGDEAAATSAALDTPTGVAIDPTASGRFYISDTHNQRVRVVNVSGAITTLAGTGVRGFGGDGGAASGAVLDRPRGVAVDASGAVYLVDSDNNRVRAITTPSTSGNIQTIAGTGEQGLAGDSGATTAAILDTPTAIVAGTGGVLTFSDTHNQRTRTINTSGANTSAINTVLGIPPQGTEGILLSGAIADTYGTGSLKATFANGGNVATGTASLLDGGVSIATATFADNEATFDLSQVNAGLHTFVVAYGGDAQNAPAASGEYVVNVLQANEGIDFPQPLTPVIYYPGASITLSATTTSGVPVTYSVTGPATLSGSTLSFTGGGTVVVTAQAGSQDYVPVSVSRTVVVNVLSLAELSPMSTTLGTQAMTLTVTGTAFAPNATVLLNGAAVVTNFVNSTTLSMTLTGTMLSTVQTLQVSVFDPTQNVTSGGLPFAVTAPPVPIGVAAPQISNPGTQPQVALTLATPYPVPVAVTLNLSFVPGPGGVDDPAIVFSNGTRTITMDIAAGQTAVPAVQLQVGTVSGVISIVVLVSAGGADVTPAGLSPTLITVPVTVPNLGSVSVTRSGQTLTVIATGYSDTREVTQANFHFTPAPGYEISDQDVTIDISSAFAAWYTQAASDAYGSTFKYTQIFVLSQDASTVGGVSVTLTNSAGVSDPSSTP